MTYEALNWGALIIQSALIPIRFNIDMKGSKRRKRRQNTIQISTRVSCEFPVAFADEALEILLAQDLIASIHQVLGGSAHKMANYASIIKLFSAGRRDGD